MPCSLATANRLGELNERPVSRPFGQHRSSSYVATVTTIIGIFLHCALELEGPKYSSWASGKRHSGFILVGAIEDPE